MAATETGVWDVQEVRDKQLANEWEYTSPEDRLFAWGVNQYGELGQNEQGPSAFYSSPIQIPGNYPKLWTTSDAGYGAASRSGSDGSGYDLWVWGHGWRGVLGLNNGTANVSSPMQIPGTNWKHVTGSIWSMTGTKTDGTLWSWGENSAGQQGVNDRTERSSPIQVGTDTTWTGAINNSATAGNHAFKTDGTLWSWGYNGYGELGFNNRTQYSSPTQVGSGAEYSAVTGRASNDIAFMKSGGTLWMAGRNIYGALGQNSTTMYSSPTQVPGTTWNSATTSYSAAMATKTDGTLWGWGFNIQGMLGTNQGPSAVASFSSPTQVGTDTTWSNTFSLGRTSGAIKTDGTLWLWGSNNGGELGQNSTAPRSSPVQLGTDTDWEKLLTASWFKQTYAGKQGL